MSDITATAETYSYTNASQRDFIRVYPSRSRSIRAFDDVWSDASDSYKSSRCGKSRAEALELTGLYRYFYLSFRNMVPGSLDCWYMGAHSKHVDDNEKTTFLLTSEGSSCGAKPLHVCFSLNPTNGVPMIRAREEDVIVQEDQTTTGTGDPVYLRPGISVMVSNGMTIIIGDLEYTVRYCTRIASPAHRQDLDDYLRTFGRPVPLPRAMIAGTPSVTRALHGYNPLDDDFPVDFIMQADVIGRGSGGAVSPGVMARTGEAIAVKYFEPGRGYTEIDFLTTIGQDRSLAGAHITKIVGVANLEGDRGKLKAGTYMAIEPLGVTDLNFRCRYDGSMKMNNVLRIVVQQPKNLHYIHNTHNTIHCDIKPGNIVLVEEDPAFSSLIDFGSKLKGPVSDYRTIGTRGYMAPELLKMRQRGSGKIGTEVDMFALGVVFYELLTAKKFDHFDVVWRDKKAVDFNVAQLKDFVESEEPLYNFNPRERVPKGFARLLRRMLEPKPWRRMSASEAFRYIREADLERAADILDPSWTPAT